MDDHRTCFMPTHYLDYAGETNSNAAHDMMLIAASASASGTGGSITGTDGGGSSKGSTGSSSGQVLTHTLTDHLGGVPDLLCRWES